jgi:hypothetical protein
MRVEEEAQLLPTMHCGAATGAGKNLDTRSCLLHAAEIFVDSYHNTAASSRSTSVLQLRATITPVHVELVVKPVPTTVWTTHGCRPAAFAGKYHRGKQKSSLLLRYFPIEHRHASAIKSDGVAAAPHSLSPGAARWEARQHNSGLQRRRRTENSRALAP